MIDEINVLKLLANDIRLRIVMLLVIKELCVCEIQGILNIPQYQVSKHLKLLKTSEILSSIKTDKYVFYSLNAKTNIIQTIISYFSSKSESFPVLEKDKMLLNESIKNNTFACK